MRDQLIAAMRQLAAAPPVRVEAPGWGVVYVRQVTVAEVDAQQDDDAASSDKSRLARAAARVLCDADGVRLFDPAAAEDVALLSQQPWTVLRKVLAAADRDSQSAGDVAGNA